MGGALRSWSTSSRAAARARSSSASEDTSSFAMSRAAASRRASRAARRSRCAAGSGTGTAASRRCVYACFGSCTICDVSPTSTSLPLCITAMRSDSSSTTARSCEMNRHANPCSRCRSVNRSRTLAWTDTSRADVGSSATSSFGSSESARAMPTRWR
ncbi:Uncharacterised protein [Mycobacteroides abscessus]|nr:Uncharacterised protein [Mycobacteroides abscessus]